MEIRGIEFLRTKLAKKRIRTLERYKWYEMKNDIEEFGISTPPELRNWSTVVGWCAKSVDSLADRLNFRTMLNDMYDMNTIYKMNNPDVLFDSAIVSALINSCSFIYIAVDDSGFPRMQVITGADATGVIDPCTNLLFEGYAVLSRDLNSNPIDEAYFLPGLTIFYHNGEVVSQIENNAPYPLLVPIIFRPDAQREFGHSRISRACMEIQASAIRTIKRAEISAEFYAVPQKYMIGLSQDAEFLDSWNAAMSSMLMVEKDNDGDSPKVGQFQQQSMQPHLEQLKLSASMFAGETGLTMDDLGFPSDNPSSVEAIKAQHENIRLTAKKAQKTFGTGFINAGYLAACLRDDFPYERYEVVETIPLWSPIFEPDATTLSLIGDGVIKINQAIPGYFTRSRLDELTGMETDKYE